MADKADNIEYPEDMRLFRIGIWANTIAWLVLVIGLIQVGMNTAQYIEMGNLFFTGMTPLNFITFFLSQLQPLISAIVLWFILRVVKEMLFLIIDIKEFVAEKAVE